MPDRRYDLEDRLLAFAAAVLAVTDTFKRSRAGNHLADQLLRAATSPYGHHGEAEGAESRDDFLHKMRVCYKELRESRRWLRLAESAALSSATESMEKLLAESDELIRIFAASIRTAKKNANASSVAEPPDDAQRPTLNT